MKGLIALAVVLNSGLAFAQAWTVPTPNTQGDFVSGFVRGNRGFLAQTQWVVTDSDRNGLNCRDGGGKVVGRYFPGQVMQASYLCDSSSDAILRDRVLGGEYWLLIHNTQPTTASAPSRCSVRANVRYVAPLSEDDVPPPNGSITLPSLPSGC